MVGGHAGKDVRRELVYAERLLTLLREWLEEAEAILRAAQERASA